MFKNQIAYVSLIAMKKIKLTSRLEQIKITLNSNPVHCERK